MRRHACALSPFAALTAVLLRACDSRPANYKTAATASGLLQLEDRIAPATKRYDCTLLRILIAPRKSGRCIAQVLKPLSFDPAYRSHSTEDSLQVSAGDMERFSEGEKKLELLI